MSDLEDLDTRLRNLLETKKDELQKEKRQLEDEMQTLELNRARFNALAGKLMTDIIDPRLRLLVERFDDAEFLPSPSGHDRTVQFNKKKHFSALVELSFHLLFDDKKTVTLEYCPRILPILMEFKRKEILTFPLEGMEKSRITQFLDDMIVGFAETYLKLQTNPHYQGENLVTDPVCKMTFHRWIASAQTVYEGNTFYFCVPSCLEKFLAEPEKFAVSKGKK